MARTVCGDSWEMMMAKYAISYCCGHGTVEKQLFGNGEERSRYIDWAEENLLCPDCYRAKQLADDASAEKIAKLCLIPGSLPVIGLEVAGQIEANKEALYKLGYRWTDSTSGGLMGYFSMKRAARVLALLCKIETVSHAETWITEREADLAVLGYRITVSLSALDMAYLTKLIRDAEDHNNAKLAARAKLAEIEALDPKPGVSPLRKRIAALESTAGGKWNGKIYGRPGGYTFYVAKTKYSASDEEVREREELVAKHAAWCEKYREIIEAAK